jgi:pterin-4a-carbinolamine dehydratase
MMNIRKRSEKQEEFANKKIEKSIRNSGADEKTAHGIAEGIKHKDGLTTSDVRKHVISELQHHHPDISKRYESFIKPATAKK